jgi:hypothetical protein
VLVGLTLARYDSSLHKVSARNAAIDRTAREWRGRRKARKRERNPVKTSHIPLALNAVEQQHPCIRCARAGAITHALWWRLTQTDVAAPAEGTTCDVCISDVMYRGRSLGERMIVVSPPPKLLPSIIQNHLTVKALTQREGGHAFEENDRRWFTGFVADANEEDLGQIIRRVIEEVEKRNNAFWHVQPSSHQPLPLKFSALSSEAWSGSFLFLLNEVDGPGLTEITDIVFAESSRRRLAPERAGILRNRLSSNDRVLALVKTVR